MEISVSILLSFNEIYIMFFPFDSAFNLPMSDLTTARTEKNVQKKSRNIVRIRLTDCVGIKERKDKKNSFFFPIREYWSCLSCFAVSSSKKKCIKTSSLLCVNGHWPTTKVTIAMLSSFLCRSSRGHVHLHILLIFRRPIIDMCPAVFVQLFFVHVCVCVWRNEWVCLCLYGCEVKSQWKMPPNAYPIHELSSKNTNQVEWRPTCVYTLFLNEFALVRESLCLHAFQPTKSPTNISTIRCKHSSGLFDIRLRRLSVYI